ncbi:threonine--tRNA ligase [Fusibacter sp. JL298sf-3]
MAHVNVRLKDGSTKEVVRGTTVYELAKAISGRLAKEALVAEVDGKLVDLSYAITDAVQVTLHKFEDAPGCEAFRHTSAHILAQAVKRLYPETQLAIGPAIQDGFYYDFDSEHVFTEQDFALIEREMHDIVKENLKLERFELPRDEAIAFMKRSGEHYKVALIEALPEEIPISFYRQGTFVDLCAGVHLPSTGAVKAFKVLGVAGAYWRGEASHKMLQRIYATSFPKAGLLQAHLTKLEEAKNRDHRKLGKELKLFAMMEEGPGFPFLLPKGVILKNLLLDYWREVHLKADYVEVETPMVLNQSLWETSGHWDHYKENMYTVSVDETDYAIKPMNCPGCMLIYKAEQRSYRAFPLRIAEIGRVHRHELSGALHGLMRVRAFTQDDAHIFMMPEQIQEEIVNIVRLLDEVYSTFGFEYHVELSTRPEASMGTDEEWSTAENALSGALDELNVSYKINAGDGAFYGPKIDFQIEDCLGRRWQCGTIQLDMQLPRRFDLSYIGRDGEKHRPVVIHRVVFGSLERFMANLIEEYAGKFPTWLAPVQVKVLSIGEHFLAYSEEVCELLKSKGIRVALDNRSEKIGYKIREAQLEKVPYMLIVGEKEVVSESVSVRSRDSGDLGVMTVGALGERLLAEIGARRGLGEV